MRSTLFLALTASLQTFVVWVFAGGGEEDFFSTIAFFVIFGFLEFIFLLIVSCGFSYFYEKDLR